MACVQDTSQERSPPTACARRCKRRPPAPCAPASASPCLPSRCHSRKAQGASLLLPQSPRVRDTRDRTASTRRLAATTRAGPLVTGNSRVRPRHAAPAAAEGQHGDECTDERRSEWCSQRVREGESCRPLQESSVRIDSRFSRSWPRKREGRQQRDDAPGFIRSIRHPRDVPRPDGPEARRLQCGERQRLSTESALEILEHQRRSCCALTRWAVAFDGAPTPRWHSQC